MKIVVVSKGSINMTTYDHVTNIAIDYGTNKATVSYGTNSTVVVGLDLNSLFILQ